MNVLHITDNTFETEVLEYQGLALVDFWAEWCGPCRVLGPIIEEIGEEYGNKIKIAKLNVDDNPVISGKFNVMSIPTMKFFFNGKEIDQIVGAAPKSTIVKTIEEHLARLAE